MTSPYSKDLLHSIECLRKELIICGLNNGLNDHKTISLSKELDFLILQYQELFLSVKT